MSRSDGRFPKYNKLEVDAAQWPEAYYDKSQKCAECGTAWPHPHIFKPSPCCDAPTKLQHGPPDMRWPDALKLLHEARFERVYEQWNEGKSDEDLEREELQHIAETLTDEDAAEEVERLMDEISSERAA